MKKTTESDSNYDALEKMSTADLLININAEDKTVALSVEKQLSQIENLINNYEPRCRLVQVHTQPMFERNGYSVQISFYVQNYPDPVVVESFLERLR